MGQFVGNPFHSERHLLWTPLSPEECEGRLDARFLDDPVKKTGWPRGPMSEYPIIGEAWSDRFTIMKRRPTSRVSFSCQPVASARIGRTANGAVIQLRLSHRLYDSLFEAFGVVWLFCGVLVLLGMLALYGPPPLVTLPGALVALGLPLPYLIWTMPHLRGQQTFRDECDWLRGFISETLAAQELPPGTTVRRRRTTK